MKKLLLTLMALAALGAASAQVVEVAEIAQVPTPEGVSVNIARISPDGSFAVFSNNFNNSLQRIDLRGGSVSTVTANGSALDLRFTPDGSTAIFRTTTTNPATRLRYHALQSMNLASGRATALTAPQRHCAAYTITTDGNVTIADSGVHRACAPSGRAVSAPRAAVVNINRGHLELTTADGVTTNLDPQGHGSYLWPALSPDGTKVVYYLVGHGCFVCNLDGSDVHALGYIHGPQWLNDSTIIGFQDYDDGQVVTASAIVAADFNGTIQTLTPDTIIGLYPSASADGKTILFSAADGSLYRISLK